jgi:uncharacterized DUF497 family protein
LADIRFEWNERKNTQNKRKHRVSFEEAGPCSSTNSRS